MRCFVRGDCTQVFSFCFAAPAVRSFARGPSTVSVALFPFSIAEHLLCRTVPTYRTAQEAALQIKIVVVELAGEHQVNTVWVSAHSPRHRGDVTNRRGRFSSVLLCSIFRPCRCRRLSRRYRPLFFFSSVSPYVSVRTVVVFSRRPRFPSAPPSSLSVCIARSVSLHIAVFVFRRCVRRLFLSIAVVVFHRYRHRQFPSLSWYVSVGIAVVGFRRYLRRPFPSIPPLSFSVSVAVVVFRRYRPGWSSVGIAIVVSCRYHHGSFLSV